MKQPHSARLERSRSSSILPDSPNVTGGTSEYEMNPNASSVKLSEALSRLDTPAQLYDTSATAKLAALVSPCFFHRRFGDAVDIEKVLEEIASDESMSHSKLVQTATGVREVSKQLQRRPIKRAVRNVMVVTKARDNNLVLLTRQLTEWLLGTPRYGSAVGVNVYVDKKLQQSKRFGAQRLLAQDPQYERMLRYWTPDLCYTSPEKFDLVITLGGDGTVLYTSWLFQRVVPPILSFSLGSLGFLTPFDFSNYREHLTRIMGGVSVSPSTVTPVANPNVYNSISRDWYSTFSKSTPSISTATSTGTTTPASPAPGDLVADAGMRVNLRMRFTCTVSPAGSKDTAQFEVLNELVIDRGPSPYVSNLEVYGDDSLLTVIQADGVIFSTPTGSTAYSLSAGGSLVHPSIPAILLTPICPHTLSFRPMLLNDTMALRVTIPRGSRANAWCSFDGKGRIELRQGDSVSIRASSYPFATVVPAEGEGWIDSVSRTLRWNTREARQTGWHGKQSPRSRRPTSVVHPLSRVGSINSGGEIFADVIDEDDDGSGTEGEEDESFDIDFDDEEEDEEKASGKDSGYGGEDGITASPMRQLSI